jgi:hypothetical protein
VPRMRRAPRLCPVSPWPTIGRDMRHAVILACGSGTRLWPASRLAPPGTAAGLDETRVAESPEKRFRSRTLAGESPPQEPADRRSSRA